MADGIDTSAAYEWYDFFARNDLDVFDVLHGAISVAVLYWPDEFLKRRNDIAQFLFAKKSSNRFLRYNGSSDDVDSVVDEPDRLRGWASDESDHISEPGICPASTLFEEKPVTKKDTSRSRKRSQEEAATSTRPHTKTKRVSTHADKDRKTSLPKKKSVISEPGTCPSASVPCEEDKRTSKYFYSSDDSEETITDTRLLPQRSRGTTQKTGRGRLIKKEIQYDEDVRLEVPEDDVEVSEAAKVCRNTVSSYKIAVANESTQGFQVVVSNRADKKETPPEEANTVTLQSSATTAALVKENYLNRAGMKQKIHDEAALERKIETAKRKLKDGYKNVQASKRRIVMIDAIDIPQQNISVPENHTRRPVND